MILIEFQNKKYQYLEVDGNMIWVDERNLAVPVMLHPKLREQAISSGVDKSVFVGDVKMPAKKKESSDKSLKSSKAKKQDLKGKFNPFKS